MANALQTRRIQLRADSRLDTRQRTPEGYLRADTALVRVGVMEYSGRELGLSGAEADLDHGVLFDRDVVFNDRTLASARMKPVTFGHPPEGVNINNHAALAVGHLGDDIREIEGGRLAASMILTSPTAIAAVENGIEETSIGFTTELRESTGQHDGNAYSFRMAGPLEINHMAIVDRGRAGPTVRIFNEGKLGMTDEELKKLISKAIAEALATQSTSSEQPPGEKNKDSSQPNELDVDALAGAIAAKLASTVPQTKQSSDQDTTEKADEQSSDSTEADRPDVAELAAARAELIVLATPVLPKDANPRSMTDREIIVAALGNSVTDADSRSDEYLRGLFDSMAASRSRATDERQRMSNAADSGSGPLIAAPTNFLEMRARRK